MQWFEECPPFLIYMNETWEDASSKGVSSLSLHLELFTDHCTSDAAHLHTLTGESHNYASSAGHMDFSHLAGTFAVG